MKKIFEILFIAVIFSVSLILYLDISSMGFPDGNLTEFERAIKRPYFIWSFTNITFGLYKIYSIFTISKFQQTKKLVLEFLIYLFVNLFIFYGISFYYGKFLKLNTGQGG